MYMFYICVYTYIQYIYVYLHFKPSIDVVDILFTQWMFVFLQQRVRCEFCLQGADCLVGNKQLGPNIIMKIINELSCYEKICP